MSNVKIEASWKEALKLEFEQPYFQSITTFLKNERAEGKVFYPPGSLIFNAFELTAVSNVKVVILGQDPYHNPGEAMGLSFSVPRGVRVPPSLQNIYKELKSDVGATIPNHGDLTAWAQQGVLLLNAMLTVEQNAAASHQHIGWQYFTDAVIRKVSNECSAVVFMLWGNYAKKKAALIDGEKHLILQSAHPSPLAGNAFQGCKHFSKANDFLVLHDKTPIDWQIV